MQRRWEGCRGKGLGGGSRVVVLGMRWRHSGGVVVQGAVMAVVGLLEEGGGWRFWGKKHSSQ